LGFVSVFFFDISALVSFLVVSVSAYP
jgi:hypothetical protein